MRARAAQRPGARSCVAVVIVGVGRPRPSTCRGRRPIVSIPVVCASPHPPQDAREEGPCTEPRPPRLRRPHCLRVLIATPASLVVAVDGARYHVTCWPRRDNPPAAGPLRPRHWVRVYNAPAPGGATLVERLTPAGAGDGCTYLLRDYDRVATAGSGADRPLPAARASRLPRHRRAVPQGGPAAVRGPAPAALDQQAPARRDLAPPSRARSGASLARGGRHVRRTRPAPAWMKPTAGEAVGAPPATPVRICP
jgi:hypothetical protein